MIIRITAVLFPTSRSDFEHRFNLILTIHWAAGERLRRRFFEIHPRACFRPFPRGEICGGGHHTTFTVSPRLWGPNERKFDGVACLMRPAIFRFI